MAISNFFSISCIRHDHLIIVGIITISYQTNTAQDVINAGYCNELTSTVTTNVWIAKVVNRMLFHNIHNSKESFWIALFVNKVAVHLSYKPALATTSSIRLVFIFSCIYSFSIPPISTRFKHYDIICSSCLASSSSVHLG